MFFQYCRLMNRELVKIDQANHYQNGKTMPAFVSWHHKEQQ